MKLFKTVKRILIGEPIATAKAAHERLTKPKALAVLSSDALSSVAYATEESLVTLSAAGVAALAANIHLALAIAALLWIVTISYRQTIFAYPNGGGAYIVAAENLGKVPGLVAAAALLIDYVLTVSVSVSSGIAALSSAFPALASWTVPIGVGCIFVITMVNLRGTRDSATIFAVPTYLFLVSILIMLAVGAYRILVLNDGPASDPLPVVGPVAGIEPLGIFLLLKAFASGCSAMTGVEAISNGVPAFRQPESKHAAQTMLAMSGLLTVTFLGITFLSHAYHLVPHESETILSQLAHVTIGSGWFYYLIQMATLFVLVLAANTSFADFPRLASILASDGFMPRQFTFRGDRLAFSIGIIMLALFAAVVLILFKGDVSALIPLYAIGVFISFTLSQSGMVIHWWRERGRHWIAKMAINGLGAVATLMVTLVAGVTKFASGDVIFAIEGFQLHAGSWVVLLLIPLQVGIFRAIHKHYGRVRRDVAPLLPMQPKSYQHMFLVPVAQIWPPTVESLAYASSLPNIGITALHVADNAHDLAKFNQTWMNAHANYPYLKSVGLRLIESPYRSLTGPILDFIDESKKTHPDAVISVVLAEFVASRWWEQVLHNHTALRLKAALLFRPGVVVISIPSHLSRTSR